MREGRGRERKERGGRRGFRRLNKEAKAKKYAFIIKKNISKTNMKINHILKKLPKR